MVLYRAKSRRRVVTDPAFYGGRGEPIDKIIRGAGKGARRSWEMTKRAKAQQRAEHFGHPQPEMSREEIQRRYIAKRHHLYKLGKKHGVHLK